MSIKRDIADIFKSNMVNSLIVVITSLSLIFILINKFLLGATGNNGLSDFFLVSTDYLTVLKHFWVIITHLFIDNSIYGLIWDMVIFYWFGYILGDLIGDKSILPAYIFTGISGALLFLSVSLVLNIEYYYLSGVRISTFGIMIASAVLVPDYNVRLIILGNVKLKYIAVAFLIINLLYLYSSNNYSYWAFIGATFAGWYYIKDVRSGRNIQNKLYKIFDIIKNLFSGEKKKKGLNVTYKSEHPVKIKKEKPDAKTNDKLNQILDKIKEVGYDNLTEAEKEFLFKSSTEL